MSSKNPGEAQRSEIRSALPRLTPRVRTAFAAACAERVIPAIEPYTDAERLHAALDLAWKYALGEELDENAIRSSIAETDTIINDLYDAGETGFVQRGAFAVYHAVSSIADRTCASAEQAVLCAEDAAWLGDRSRKAELIEKEAEWQLRALHVALAWRDAHASRDMFYSLDVARE